MRTIIFIFLAFCGSLFADPTEGDRLTLSGRSYTIIEITDIKNGSIKVILKETNAKNGKRFIAKIYTPNVAKKDSVLNKLRTAHGVVDQIRRDNPNAAFHETYFEENVENSGKSYFVEWSPLRPLVDNYMSEVFQNPRLSERSLKHRMAVALKIVDDIYESLELLWKKNYVHGDLKQHNLVYGDDKVVKITDFETIMRLGTVFKKNSQDPSSFRTHTPGFSPPELAEGYEAQKSFDLYSLGVTILRLSTEGLEGDFRVSSSGDESTFAASDKDRTGAFIAVDENGDTKLTFAISYFEAELKKYPSLWRAYGEGFVQVLRSLTNTDPDKRQFILSKNLKNLATAPFVLERAALSQCQN